MTATTSAESRIAPIPGPTAAPACAWAHYYTVQRAQDPYGLLYTGPDGSAAVEALRESRATDNRTSWVRAEHPRDGYRWCRAESVAVDHDAGGAGDDYDEPTLDGQPKPGGPSDGTGGSSPKPPPPPSQVAPGLRAAYAIAYASLAELSAGAR